jgi:phosphoserine aminotransferase
MKHIQANFTPGPSQLYFTVPDHLRKSLKEGVSSLSHRSKVFENIFQQTVEGLRELLSIPNEYHIFFLGSATEIFERIIQNLVEENSVHFVNGSFSKRFYETAIQYKKSPRLIEAGPGQGFDSALNYKSELVAITHNETSTGVSLPIDFISEVRTKNPEALIIVDAVSSLPYPAFDFNKIDSLFFSVQKGFGLPAGLGVWIVNDRCIEKAAMLESKNISTGSYHNLASLLSHAKKNQTPETPNVLSIYLLGNVIKDMLSRGIQTIRRETDYKSAILYQLLNNHSLMKPFVTDKKFQSKTVIVADCGDNTNLISNTLHKKGMVPGDGYGPFKKTQLRFANFPTHSKEQFELLVDTLESLKS